MSSIQQQREYEKDPGWQYLKVSDETRRQDSARPYDSKKDVWIPDAEEGYIEGQVLETKGDNVVVQNRKGNKVTLKKEQVQEMNPPKFDKCEDMSNLSFLNDASVLGNLRQRYGSMLIYTYSGLFCVVINPYKRLPIYTDSVAMMYMGKRKNEMPPHLFATSDEAYRSMLQDRQNQSMLITGESGAGKTENTKKVISYFASVGASQSAAKKDDAKKKVSLEDQIVQTNPVLEAFGNAKTVRNNNSSRFGKFIRIHFSGGGKVASCDIEHYLLEKSRVIRQAPGERCYHIYYQIYSSADLRKKLLLDQELKYYHNVSQAELSIAGVDDDEEYRMTDEAFDILMFSAEEKFNCYRIISALMHIGECHFKAQSSKDEQANPDGTDEPKKTCEMFGIDTDAFLKALCSPRVKVGTEWVNKGQTVQQVYWGIGAMCKGTYDRVFTWLVNMCNKTLDCKELERKYFIGVLDIAGFEIFDFNSFEQLWINFVNEKLQQFFNHHMFVLEQEEYKKEGIVWTFIDFGLDLAACIELIEKPMGIISMLDEECVVPKGTDDTLAQKLVDTHLGKHPNFQKPKPPKGKQAEAHFAMAHYAGLVRYNVSNWLEKNKDPLNDTCVSVMKQSKSNPLLLTIWADYQTQEEAAAAEKAGGQRKKGKSGSMMTVSMKYREGLNNLMNMLHATHPSFVRCLIPNELKKSGLLDASLVMNQLTCNGVLEGIRICRKGFPNRTPHTDFKLRYAMLAPGSFKEDDDGKTVSGCILKVLIKQKKITDEQFKVGLTKVFFKAGILAHMEDLRDEKLAEIVLGMQCQIRNYLAANLYGQKRRKLDAYFLIQENIRQWAVLRDWAWYGTFGMVRPMCGQTAAEIEKFTKLIKEGQAVVDKAAAKRVETEKKLAEKDAAHKELEKEMELRNQNANFVVEKRAKLEREVRDMEGRFEDMRNGLTTWEQRNKEARGEHIKLEEETTKLKGTRVELEERCKNVDEERKDLEEQINFKENLKRKADLDIYKFNTELKEFVVHNNRLKEDIAAAEDRSQKMSRECATLTRRCEDLEEMAAKEGGQAGDMKKVHKNLDEELQKALEKVTALQEKVDEADKIMREKDTELRTANERLKDEELKVGRLEHQLIELAGTCVMIGKTNAASSYY